MSDRPKIGLDNATFRGRLRQPDRPYSQPMRGVSRQPFGPRVADMAVNPVAQLKVIEQKPVTVENSTVHVVTPQPYARPAFAKQQQSTVLHRRSVKTPYGPPKPVVQAEKKVHHRKKLVKPNKKIGVIVAASFALLIGVFAGVSSLKSSPSQQSQAKVLSQTIDKSAENIRNSPSENRPTLGDVSSYKVAADQPKIIQIAKLNVYARVRPMSVNAKNELQSPPSIFDAGWYNGSAKPGDLAGSGATLINGFVAGSKLPGIFANAKKLAAGDVIQVIRGDNKTFTYTVVKTQSYNAASLDIGTALTSAQPDKAALNLITISGQTNPAKGQYEERTVVFAVQT